MHFHPPGLKLRDEIADAFGTQRVALKLNRIPFTKSLVVHERRDVNYVVIRKIQPLEVLELGEWGDIAYLVILKNQHSQAGQP